MKNRFLIALLMALIHISVQGQETPDRKVDEAAMVTLIDAYSRAREIGDTILLKRILTTDIDQLVSNGVWRTGLDEAMAGMQQSSNTNPGTRSLTIDKIRFLGATLGIVDARYVITHTDGTVRNMWSTFITVLSNGQWRISAIRNMLPTGQH